MLVQLMHVIVVLYQFKDNVLLAHQMQQPVVLIYYLNLLDVLQDILFQMEYAQPVKILLKLILVLQQL